MKIILSDYEIPEVKKYLQDNGFSEEKTNGQYEFLRMKKNENRLIFYQRKNGNITVIDSFGLIEKYRDNKNQEWFSQQEKRLKEKEKTHEHITIKGHTDYNAHQSGGKCEVCGKVKKSTSSYFLEVSWFRGEDEYIGKCCDDCTMEFHKKNGISWSGWIKK